MNTHVEKLTLSEIKKLKQRYAHCDFRYDLPHTHFQIKGSDFTITVYKSGKAVYQAADLSLHLPNIKHEEKETIDTLEMSGSDEVGTGDYFGPITVCAVILENEDYDKIPTSKIMDSKRMKDDDILEIAPLLTKQLKYSLLTLDNKTYNKIHKTNNINAIKAKLHNQAFLHLDRKYGLPKTNIIDQFAPKPLYYRYLKDEPEVYKDLIFETKAEDRFLAVACGAIIARYAFLKALDKMGETYQFVFPKGAGPLVDEKAREFVLTHGAEALNDVAKVHFKNTERVLENL